jgi:hypothetical protein
MTCKKGETVSHLAVGVSIAPTQICAVPEAEPSPQDGGWAPRRGPQPLNSGEAIRRATHLRAKVAASPSDLLNPCDLETASRWEGRAFADLPDPIQSIGGELVPADTDHRHGNSMRNTVAFPSCKAPAIQGGSIRQDLISRPCRT